jgi:phage terminase small subunit
MILNPRQSRFVEEYLIDLNATQAAIRAGYSARTANKTGPRLMVNVGIQNSIAELQAERSEAVGLTVEKILNDIDLIMQNSMITDESGKMINSAAALKACELLGKYKKMFVDKIEHSGGQTLQVITGVNAAD